MEKKTLHRVNIGLIGYGTVGSGVVKLLRMRDDLIRNKFKTHFIIKTLCDRSYHKKDTTGLFRAKLTRHFNDVLDDPGIDVVIELIGGLQPAKTIVSQALKRGKHVVTANKELIANHGRELFQLARRYNRNLYFESSVMAGIPVIKTLSEGVAGNKFSEIHGIINGTCNFILTEMTDHKRHFYQALEEAQRKGYAESNPRLDINGMDSAHKLCILVFLAFGKFVKLNDIYTEGISHLSPMDIEFAQSLNLCVKLLAIGKKANDMIEARVHPTLIPKEHPLASIKGVYNALHLEAHPLGDVLISGKGAGQMSAATGIVSDLINTATRGNDAQLLANLFTEAKNQRVRRIDQVRTKYYLRFMAFDKPGVLAKISGILGKHNIGINSVHQKQHKSASAVPVIMLTNYTTEKMVRLALDKISKLTIVTSKPIAIRLEDMR